MHRPHGRRRFPGRRRGCGRAGHRRRPRRSRRPAAGAGIPLPGRVEPHDLGQFGGAELAAISRNMPPASTGPSWAVSPVATTSAPAPVRVVHDQGQVRGGELAGLVQDQHVPGAAGPGSGAGPSLRSCRGTPRCCTPRPGPRRHLPGRVLRGGDPDDPPPGQPGPRRANAATVWVLPAPAGAVRTVVATAAVSSRTAASSCSCSARSDRRPAGHALG